MTTTPVIDEHAPVAELEKILPESLFNFLDDIGNRRDRDRWAIGDICIELITGKYRILSGVLGQKEGTPLPAMQTYELIAKRVDYGKERVRDFHDNSKYYSQETRECYDALHYSIFEHARRCPYPEQVLQKALEGRQTLSVVKFTNPTTVDSLKAAYARVPYARRNEANQIMQIAEAKLRELSD